MQKILLAVYILPAVSVLALCGPSLKWAAACPGSNSANVSGETIEYWDDDQLPAHATFIIVAEWHTTGTPFIGVLEGSHSQYVSAPTYTPAYFFPSSCEGSVNVTVDCDMLTGNNCQVNQGITSVLTVGPTPYYATDTNGTLIRCP